MKFLKDKFLSSDFGILLSLGTFIGYAAYYTFAIKFNEYYKLPFRFIDFSLQSVALTVFVVILFLCCLAYFIETPIIITKLFPLLSIKDKKTRDRIETLFAIFFIFLVVIGMALKIRGFSYYDLPWMYIVDFVGYLGMAWILWNAYKAKSNISFIAMAIVCFILLCNLTGTFIAMKKEDYLILERKNHQNYVVINTYSDQFIIAPVDLKKKIITPKFEFIEMKSDKDTKVELNLTHTGRLTVKNYAD